MEGNLESSSDNKDLIVREGKTFLSASVLAEVLGYDRDHIGLLARQGKVEAIKVEDRWFVSRESLEAYQRLVDEKKKVEALQRFHPKKVIRPKLLEPSLVLSIPDRIRAIRSYLSSAAFKTALRYALVALFILFIFTSLSAFAQSGSLRNAFKNLVDSTFWLTEKTVIELEGYDDLKDDFQIFIITFGDFNQKFTASIFETGRKYASANIFNFFSPAITSFERVAKFFFDQSTENKIVELEKTIEDLEDFKNYLNKIGVLTQTDNNQVIVKTLERVVTVGPLTNKQIEERFLNIERILADYDERFQRTPTILVPIGGGGGGGSGNSGVTVLNPSTIDSQTVKVSNLLDVDGSADIAGALSVSGNFTLGSTSQFSGSGLTDCDGGTQSLKWDETGKKFSCGSGGVSSNSIDFDEITASATFDTNWDVALNSKNLDIGDGVFFINGSNNRIGIGTNSPDVKLEVVGTASTSALLGSVFNFSGNCNDESQTLLWNSSTGTFSCGADSGAGAGAEIKVEKSGATVLSTATILNFDDAKFELAASGSTEVSIDLDWGAGGPASLSQNETVTGDWIFDNDILLRDNSTARFIFASTSTGRFGFGDVTPETFFEIASSSGIVASISNTFFVDASNKRVGVNPGATINTALEVGGSASISADIAFFGEIQPDGLTCANGEILKKTAANDWDCAADATGGGGAALQVRDFPLGTTVSNVATISFDAGAFNVTSSASVDAVVKLDYDNGPASRAKNETITGLWDFTGASTQFVFFEVTNASASGNFELTGTSSKLGINAGNVINVALEVGGSASISGTASVSGDFVFFGEIRPDGVICSNGQILKKTAANDWDCAADATGGGGGALIEVREGFTGDGTNVSSVSFDAGAFNISFSGAESLVRLDYDNGPASRAANQTITGFWEFRNGASFSNDIEFYNNTGSRFLTVSSVSSGRFSIGDSTPETFFEIASSSGIVASISNTFFVDAANSRVGINPGTTINTALEVGGSASISADIAFFGEILPDGLTCANGEILKKTAANDWDCASDATGGGGGAGIEVKETGVFQDVSVASISFHPAHFGVTASGTEDVLVKLDWDNGPASRTADQTITGFWKFNAASTQLTGLELAGFASVSITGTSNSTINLTNTGDLLIQDAGTTFVTFRDDGVVLIDNIQLDTNTITTSTGNLTLDAAGNTITLNNAAADLVDITGRASVSSTFEVGTNVFYVDQANSRVGIGTQNLTQALEVVGGASISGTASISGDLVFQGEIRPDGAICANGEILKKTAANDWDCATDATGGGGGAALQVRDFPLGTTVSNVATISFDAGAFTVSASGSVDAVVKLDYDNGPASRAKNETITGLWKFSGASTQFTGLELAGFASVSATGTNNFTINLTSTGDFIVQDNGTTFFTLLDTGGASVSGQFTLDMASTRAFVVGDGSGGFSDDIFTVDTTASATNPGIDITATNLTTAGTSALTITVPASASARIPHAVLWVTDTNSLTLASMSNAGRLGLRGSINTHGATSNCTGVSAPNPGCVDLAESFLTNDTTLVAGEVVSIDTVNPQYVIRATAGSIPIGVFSTNPAALITGLDFRTGSEANIFSGQVVDGRLPVTLAGRAPVRVSTENGPIEIGDLLTVSSTPGVAMKATKSGRVLGLALEPFEEVASGSYSEILVFINPHWYGGDNFDNTLDLSAVSSSSLTYDESGTVDAGGAIFDINILFQSIVNKFNEAFNIVFKQNFLKIAEIFTDKLTTKELCVEEVCVKKEQFKSLLEQNSSLLPTPISEPDSISSPQASPEPTPSQEPISETTPEPTPSESPTPEPTPVVEVGEVSAETSESADFTTGQSPETTPEQTP